MPIGKQPFDLPISTVKKETSIDNKILIQSHVYDETTQSWIAAYYDKTVNRLIHTQNIKIKFFVIGYRLLTEDVINYVGRWVELEPYQRDYVASTYLLGFYPYSFDEINELHIRLQLHPIPNTSLRSEIYIEKLTIMDSEFGAEDTWLTDPDIPEIVPNPENPGDPDKPKIVYPDANNVWPFM